MGRALNNFMHGDWAGAGVLSESGRIEHCDAALGPRADLNEALTVCEKIETAIEMAIARDHPTRRHDCGPEPCLEPQPGGQLTVTTGRSRPAHRWLSCMIEAAGRLARRPRSGIRLRRGALTGCPAAPRRSESHAATDAHLVKILPQTGRPRPQPSLNPDWRLQRGCPGAGCSRQSRMSRPSHVSPVLVPVGAERAPECRCLELHCPNVVTHRRPFFWTAVLLPSSHFRSKYAALGVTAA
jgi:hypothetical protein